MCAAMNNLDENETGEGTKELDDLLGSEEMKDLDVLMEFFEDQVYTEIFDDLMTFWKRKELEGQQGHSPCLLRGDKRSKSMQSNCQKSSRLTKFATIDEEEPHDIRRACLSEASRRPLVGIVNTRREQLLELDTLFYREDKEDNKNKDNSKVVKPKTKSSAEADICANTIQTLWPQTVIGSRAQPVPLPVPLYVPVPVKVPLPVPVPTKEDPSLDEDAVEQRQKKGMIARGLTKLDKIRKSISLPNIGSGAASVWHESRPIASTADKQKEEEEDKGTLREVLEIFLPRIPIEKREKAKQVLQKLVAETKNITMLTFVLTDKLTKNKKVFGSTIDKILESEKRPKGIPMILEVAFEMVGKPENVEQEGIYRQNGNMNLILGLKVDVEKGRVDKLKEVDNVHLITGLVKMFFKDLKEPLISEGLLMKLSTFVEEEQSSKKRDSSLRRKDYSEIFMSGEVKPSHRRTLVQLLKHLDKVEKHQSRNKMTKENLAIVLGPTLSRIPANTLDMKKFVYAQNAVVRLMLEDRQCKWALEDSVK